MVHRFPRWLFGLAAIVVIAVPAVVGWFGWSTWRSSPEYAFRDARTQWQNGRVLHYRMEANYSTGFAQCHYDIEVKTRTVIRVHGMTCLSAATTNTLTIESIFEVFSQYVDDRICGPNGCSCEGAYVVKATYDPEYGYPRTISTTLQRNLLESVLSTDEGSINCRRARGRIDRIEILAFTPLP